MEYIVEYDEFVNEGFMSKTFLALSLALSTLFSNVQAGTIITGSKADTTASAKIEIDTPIQLDQIKDNYLEIYNILVGLTKHVKDPTLDRLIKDLVGVYKDFYGNNHQDQKFLSFNVAFAVKMNKIKPRLIEVIHKYNKTASDYNIEEIYKHIEAKDFNRLSSDMRYIRFKFDEISAKYKLTGWEKMDSEDRTGMIILGIIGLLVSSGAIGGTTYWGVAVARRRRRRIEDEARRARQAEDRRRRAVREEQLKKDRDAKALVNKFKNGIMYFKADSKYNGMKGTYLGKREQDGKYYIEFEGGARLYATPTCVRPYNPEIEKHKKDDPYGEENWEA